MTLRGPETVGTMMDCPPEGEWLGIRFKVGSFMPRFSPANLCDHRDANLPAASGRSFWLNGSAVEYPDFENAERLVNKLVTSGLLVRDSVVDGVLRHGPGVASKRTAQRHFLQSAGITYAQFLQVERARYAALLLRQNVPILDVVGRARYFDQAHLTRSFRRFIGDTPTNIVRCDEQLSFLYKTDAFSHDTFLS